MDIITNDYISIFTAIVTIASAIVNYTDTPKDDGFIKKIYKVIEFFAMVNYKAKDK
jgi:hypothetical protein